MLSALWTKEQKKDIKESKRYSKINLKKKTMKETIEGNKLIAEFMGNKCKDDLWYMPNQSQFAFQGDYSYKMDAFYSKDLKFHSSWDWLMPVVERIRHSNIGDVGYGVTFHVQNDACWFGIDNSRHKELNTYMEKELQEAVWKAVIEFIKWYNEQEKEVPMK